MSTLRHGEQSFGEAEHPTLIRVPVWSHLPWLRAAFSTRTGGLSQAYGPNEQNLGWTREDDADIVAANRLRFLQATTQGAKLRLVTVRQTHSADICDLEPSLADEYPSAEGSGNGRSPLEGDGLISSRAGLALGILTADCVSVLMTDTRTRAVAAFHAGWRGTLARIVETGANTLRSRHGSRPGDFLAAIGPAIRPCCFEVGEEVRSAFSAEFPYADRLFSTRPESKQSRLDLHEANRRQLLEAGLASKQIQIVDECTACCRAADDRRKYFSYRAENGVTGRMLSVIGAVPD